MEHFLLIFIDKKSTNWSNFVRIKRVVVRIIGEKNTKKKNVSGWDLENSSKYSCFRIMRVRIVRVSL